jgi:PAS domain S-box-containing protein
MRRRISVLVALGFALLLGLGVLTSLAMIAGLRETMSRAAASQASTLEVRASVRSLRADYLASSDAVSRLMLQPALAEAWEAKRQADADAAEHLAGAMRATRRPDLSALLETLRTHDGEFTNRIEDVLLGLAVTAPERAKDVYFREYLPARAVNLTLVGRALGLAGEEVAVAADYAAAKARQTIALAWLAFALFVIVGTTGGLRLSGAVRDVARDFEEAAAKVSEQRDHLHAVMTAMRDALVVVDARGIVTTANDAACALLGYGEAELVGTALDRHAREVGRDPAARNEPIAFRARNGTHIPMSVSAAPLHGPDGAVAGTVWVARDMRDHLRMLAEVEAARDAALEGSRTKSEFLANMSHEIRTPMHVIIGYTDMALETDVTAEQHGYLDGVRRSAIALLEIINAILDLSKVEAGKLTLESVPFGLRGTLSEVLRTLEVRAHEKGLRLVTETSPAVPDGLLGDPTRLRQVVLNLVGNAVKFTDDGEVVVRVGVESPAAGGAAVLHFAVADTGIGIPPDKQEAVFRAFTQADGSMTRRYGGTGLGLTIAAQLVGMMGGRIWVESKVGTGSVFHFTARFTIRDAGKGAAPGTPSDPLRGVA